MLAHFNRLKQHDGHGEIREPAEGFSVLVPRAAVITREECVVAITKLNRAKEAGDAEVTFTFSRGEMIKRGWTLLKHDGALPHRLSAGGTRPREL